MSWQEQVKELEQTERNLSFQISEVETKLQRLRKVQRDLVASKKKITKKKLALQEANMEITKVVKKRKFDPITAKGLAFLESLKGGSDEEV